MSRPIPLVPIIKATFPDTSFRVTAKHPELDCVILNAGQQHPVNLAEPAKTDVPRFHAEVDINFTCMVDLSLKFLPFLMDKKSKTALIL